MFLDRCLVKFLDKLLVRCLVMFLDRCLVKFLDKLLVRFLVTLLIQRCINKELKRDLRVEEQKPIPYLHLHLKTEAFLLVPPYLDLYHRLMSPLIKLYIQHHACHILFQSARKEHECLDSLSLLLVVKVFLDQVVLRCKIKDCLFSIKIKCQHQGHKHHTLEISTPLYINFNR